MIFVLAMAGAVSAQSAPDGQKVTDTGALPKTERVLPPDGAEPMIIRIMTQTLDMIENFKETNLRFPDSLNEIPSYATANIKAVINVIDFNIIYRLVDENKIELKLYGKNNVYECKNDKNIYTIYFYKDGILVGEAKL